MEDSRIIELFHERSEQAIAELSDKYGALCLRTAENILNDRRDAEECVEDAYLAVWNNVPPERPDPLSAYLLRIVRNLSLKKVRENTAKKRNSSYDAALEELEEILPSSVLVEEETEARETAEAVDRFLGTLEKTDRVLFVRRYFFGDSLSSLSELTGKSSHYLSVRLSRIRKSLRSYLEKEGNVNG